MMIQNERLKCCTSEREFEVVETLLSISHCSPMTGIASKEIVQRWEIPTPPLSEEGCESPKSIGTDAPSLDTCRSERITEPRISPPLKKRLLRQVKSCFQCIF